MSHFSGKQRNFKGQTRQEIKKGGDAIQKEEEARKAINSNEKVENRGRMFDLLMESKMALLEARRFLRSRRKRFLKKMR